MRPFSRPWSRREFLRTAALTSAGCLVGNVPFRAARAAPADAAPNGDAFTRLEPLLQELVATMEKKVPFASALAIRRGGVSISVDDQSKEIGDSFPSEGVVFTAYNGSWLEERATNSIDEASLRETVRALVEDVRLQRGGPDIAPGEGGRRSFHTPCEKDPRALSLPEKLDWVASTHTRVRGLDASLTNCRIGYLEDGVQELYVNRAKSWSQDLLRVRLNVTCFATDSHGSSSNFNRVGGTGGMELLGFSDDALAALVADTRALVSAGRIEPGEHDAIVDGSVAGTLAHESFGHGVELDMFVKDRALAEQYLGKRVGSDLVNIVDDPSLATAFGSYFFDHEGQPSNPTSIVEGGIFRRGLSDLLSAARLGVPRSANGRRQDVSRKAYARMSNTFFSPGTASLDEVVQGVSKGVLLENFTHGVEDPKGWGILVVAQLGREIRDGRLTGRIFSPVAITGYVPDVLASVSAVTKDFVTVPAGCGKGFKEFVSVSTGGPHLRLRARLA